MSSCIQNCGAFSRLFESQAKGFFFVKFALTDFTSEVKLDAIMRKAHAAYDRAVADRALAPFLPSFFFRPDCAAGNIRMVIQKDATPEEEAQTMAEVMLVQVVDPVTKQPALSLSTDRELPVQKLRRLNLVDLKKHMEVYLEVLESPQSVLLDRLLKTFCDLEKADPGDYTYDLTSTVTMVGVSSCKGGHRHLVLAVHL